ncbi:MAG: hypothetical protein WB510_00925 [Candidatus Sulfotelmatobacter sp.]
MAEIFVLLGLLCLTREPVLTFVGSRRLIFVPTRKRILLTAVAIFIAHAGPLLAQEQHPAFHATTDWDVRPSLKFDALCALNFLSGDPFYLDYYKSDYDRLSPQLRPEERAAFVSLKRRIKDENGGIVSAKLALYFSATDAETLDDLIRVVKDSSAMQRNLRATPYYDDDGWKVYEESRPDLEAAFRALKRIHFEDDWEKHARPGIEKSRAAIVRDLPKYNVIPAVESVLGVPRPTNKITVYLLYYSEPHGIKITGTRFLTHYSYPFRIVLRNAIHEMMHPPYDLAHDAGLRAALQSLRSDSFLMDKVEHHDRSFGYNSLEGLEEEDCVQALEQILAERFGMGGDPRRYWKEQDDGIHVLAVALYSLMKEQHFPDHGETFPAFLYRMIHTGHCRTGRSRNSIEHFSPTRQSVQAVSSCAKRRTSVCNDGRRLHLTGYFCGSGGASGFFSSGFCSPLGISLP